MTPILSKRERALIERERMLKEIEKQKRSIDFYRIRVEAIERNIDLFPEPYKTYLCNVLANGKIDVKEQP